MMKKGNAKRARRACCLLKPNPQYSFNAQGHPSAQVPPQAATRR